MSNVVYSSITNCACWYMFETLKMALRTACPSVTDTSQCKLKLGQGSVCVYACRSQAGTHTILAQPLPQRVGGHFITPLLPPSPVEGSTCTGGNNSDGGGAAGHCLRLSTMYVHPSTKKKKQKNLHVTWPLDLPGSIVFLSVGVKTSVYSQQLPCVILYETCP